jgi:hypothetical protein
MLAAVDRIPNENHRLDRRHRQGDTVVTLEALPGLVADHEIGVEARVAKQFVGSIAQSSSHDFAW